MPEVVAESGGGLVFRDRLGEAGYRAYCSRWTEEVYIERYLRLIEEIRARKRSPDLPA